MKSPVSLKSLSFLVLSSFVGTANAGTFSVALGGPSGLPGDEVFAPGPIPGGVGGTPFEVDGLSYGHFGVNNLSVVGGLEFSVDPAAVSAFAGSPIGMEVGSGEAASSDIYGAPFPPVGAHFGVWDGDGVGPGPNGPGGSPPLGLIDGPVGGDDVDAWDSRIPAVLPPALYYSLDPASAGAVGAAPGDILIAALAPGYAGTGAIYAPLAALGLVAGDDVDALVIIENDGMPGVFTPGVDAIVFSLAPGSPTLGGFGLSAADILIDAGAAGPLGIPTVGGLGTPGFVVPAAALDLAFTDNLNALDIIVQIPEPGTFSLLGLSLVGLLLRRRRA